MNFNDFPIVKLAQEFARTSTYRILDDDLKSVDKSACENFLKLEMQIHQTALHKPKRVFSINRGVMTQKTYIEKTPKYWC